MSMGLVDDKEFETELLKSRIVNIRHGRNPGDKNVPDSLRQIIGENTVEEGRNGTKTLARAFGISDSSLNAYSQGARSTTTYHDRPNQDVIAKARERIVKKARNRLVSSLDNITPAKLAEEKPRDLAAIAKDMSSIIKDFEPRSDDNIRPQALIIFAPPMKNESQFDVIDAEEL